MINDLFDSYGTDEPAVDTRTTEEIAEQEAAFIDATNAFFSDLDSRPGVIRR